MPGRVNAVTIEVATESRRCAIISVQNNTVSMQFVYALDSLSNYANCTTILHPFLTIKYCTVDTDWHSWILHRLIQIIKFSASYICF
jgi:hypothetical protein